MFYAIDIGHNAPPSDTGAIGIKKEDELTKIVGVELDHILRSRGHKTVFVAPQTAVSVSESLDYRCSLANELNCDRYISIHFNAFNKKANGTEVYIASPKSKFANEAKSVVEHIADLGFANRGVKIFRWQVLQKTRMPAMLIECCFCDSDRDMQIFNAKDVAFAIASGLLGEKLTSAKTVERVAMKATLTVKVDTLLKPLPYQSFEITKMIEKGECDRKMQNIAIGEYDVLFLAEEEGHYAINFDNEKWFIFSGHGAISPSPEAGGVSD